MPKSEYWTTAKIIGEFHRAKDGFIAFCRRRPKEDGLQPVRSVLRSHLLKFKTGKRWPELKADGFFTPVAFYKHNGPTDGRPYGPAYRRQRGLKYLNTCFVDLDFYNANLTFEDTLREVRRLVCKNQIPKPSIIADSGSGMWLFWLLHDGDDKSAPPKGDPKHYASNFQLWRRVEEGLISRLRHLGADPAAKDGARLARIPGSINRKAKRRVRYSPQYADRSQRISYSLCEMADSVKIPRKTYVPQKPDTKKKVPVAVRKQARRARRALFESRLKQLQRVEKYRNGLKKGTRENGLLLFAALMKSLGWKPRLIEKEIIRLGRRCNPPLDTAASLARMRAADGAKRIRDETIAQWLRVTPKEKSKLKLTWPVAGSTTPAKQNGTAAAAARMQKRQEILNQLLKRYGTMSAQKLKDRYAKKGIYVSEATAARDLKSD